MAIKTIGYIGLGNAGSSMAANLPRHGFQLIVHDASPESEKAFAKNNPGVRIADRNDPNAFADAEVIVTMLPQGIVVREVMLENPGFAKGLKPGSIIIDTSSSSPYGTVALGKELAEHELILIDAPITQTHMHATDTGDATAMVGCDSPEALEKCLPVLQAMYKYVFHMGPLGSGHAMKTLKNYCYASALIGLSDALVAGQKYGLDPVQMLDVLNVGTGKSFGTYDSVRNDGLTRQWNTGFQLKLLIKDLGITKEMFDKVGFETEVQPTILQVLKHAKELTSDNADHVEILKGRENKAGIQLNKGKAEGKTVMAIREDAGVNGTNMLGFGK